MIVAMVLAGGNGTRVGADRPKQFVEVLGKPILAYTLDIFQQNDSVDAITVVCHPEWQSYLQEIVKVYGIYKVKWIADGGASFQDSVINGVNLLKKHLMDNDTVILHYAAAPFTSQKIVNDSLKVCQQNGMAVSCTPCFQLLGSNDGDVSREWIDRDKITQVCCPQSFRFGYLVDIYERAISKGIIETTEPHTTSLMYALGDKLYKSYGDQTNIKITTKEDIELFEGYVLYLKRKCTH